MHRIYSLDVAAEKSHEKQMGPDSIDIDVNMRDHPQTKAAMVMVVARRRLENKAVLNNLSLLLVSRVTGAAWSAPTVAIRVL